MEKKYRQGYDNIFFAHPCFEVKNEIIAGLTIIIKYKLFDVKSNNIEITFTEKEQPIGRKLKYISENAELGDYYINDFLKCFFDKNYQDYIKLEEINKEELEKMGYRIEYEISNYFKDVLIDEQNYYAESKKISKKEFYKILSENISNFDNKNNVFGTISRGCINYPIKKC